MCMNLCPHICIYKHDTTIVARVIGSDTQVLEFYMAVTAMCVLELKLRFSAVILNDLNYWTISPGPIIISYLYLTYCNYIPILINVFYNAFTVCIYANFINNLLTSFGCLDYFYFFIRKNTAKSILEANCCILNLPPLLSFFLPPSLQFSPRQFIFYVM